MSSKKWLLALTLACLALGCADVPIDGGDDTDEREVGVIEQSIGSDIIWRTKQTPTWPMLYIGTSTGFQFASFQHEMPCSSAGSGACFPFASGYPATWAGYWLEQVNWSWTRANHPRAYEPGGYQVKLCLHAIFHEDNNVAYDHGCIDVTHSQTGSTLAFADVLRMGYWMGTYPLFRLEHRITPSVQYPYGSAAAPINPSTVSVQAARINCWGNDWWTYPSYCGHP